MIWLLFLVSYYSALAAYLVRGLERLLLERLWREIEAKAKPPPAAKLPEPKVRTRSEKRLAWFEEVVKASGSVPMTSAPMPRRVAKMTRVFCTCPLLPFSSQRPDKACGSCHGNGFYWIEDGR